MRSTGLAYMGVFVGAVTALLHAGAGTPTPVEALLERRLGFQTLNLAAASCILAALVVMWVGLRRERPRPPTE